MHKQVTHWSHVSRCVRVGEKVPGAVTKGEFTVCLCGCITLHLVSTPQRTNFSSSVAVAQLKLLDTTVNFKTVFYTLLP